jgi:hypothetical protein
VVDLSSAGMVVRLFVRLFVCSFVLAILYCRCSVCARRERACVRLAGNIVHVSGCRCRLLSASRPVYIL